MAKAKPPEGNTKSDIVREYLRSAPNASANQIVADLKAYGISLALAKKVKSKEGLKRRETGGKSVRAKSARVAAPVKSEAGTKADAIRQVAQGLTKPIRPRDVLAALAEKGIAVSNAQVGQVLKGMGMRRRRGRRAMKVEVVASTLTLESLLAAKKLVNQLGSVEVAKTAVDALVRLR